MNAVILKGQPNRKSSSFSRKTANTPMKTHLAEYVRKAHERGLAVTRAMLQAKALEMHKIYGGEEGFKASEGFVTRFIEQYNLKDMIANCSGPN